MADVKISALTAMSVVPALGDLFPLVDISDTTQSSGGTTKRISYSQALVPFISQLNGGRLTLENSVPVSTSDQTAVSTLRWSPFRHSWISTYDGGGTDGWEIFDRTTDLTFTLSGLTSGKNYDVFIYNNSGTLTLELSAAWASDTSRTDALTTVHGIYFKSSALSRRWLGTLRTTGTTTTEDSAAKRYLFNAYNTVPREVKCEDGDTSAYNSSTTRQVAANAANQVEIVNGWPRLGDLGMLGLMFSKPMEVNSSGSADEIGLIGIGDNSTTAYINGSYTTAINRIVNANGSDVLIRQTVTVAANVQPRLGWGRYTMLQSVSSGNVQYLPGVLRGMLSF